MPNKEIPNQIEKETIKKEEHYDPNSQRLIPIQNKDGSESLVTVKEWLLSLNTNGRGGT